MIKKQDSINIGEDDLDGRSQVWIRFPEASVLVVMYPNHKSITSWISRKEPVTRIIKKTVRY